MKYRLRRKRYSLRSSVTVFPAVLIAFIGMSGGQAQATIRWRFWSGSDGGPPALTSDYLEVRSSSTSNGGNVDVWNNNSTATQYWTHTKSADGLHWIEYNANSGLALSAYASDCSIHQWAYEGSANELWTEQKIGTGYWALINWSGCEGDPYTDELANPSFTAGTTLKAIYNYANAYCGIDYNIDGCLWN